MNHDEGQKELQERIAKLEAQAEEHLNGWRRAKADYLNLKKDVEKEKTEIAKFAAAGLLAQLLPLADSFDLALAHIPADQREQEWVKGILAMHKQLADMFGRLGLEKVREEGEFDPAIHEAVAHEPHEGTKPNHIFETVQAGYTLHGQLLRPARVKVSQEKTNNA